MADVLDIVDINTVQAAIKAPDSGLALLEGYITVVSRHIDALCGPVVVRTVTGELHHGGGYTITLRKYPVDSITTVTENGTSVAAAGYHIDLESGTLERVTSYTSTFWLSGRWNIAVTYVAGRYATTAVVDPLFAQAATMAVQGLWESQQALGGTQTFGGGGEGLDMNSAVPGGGQYVLPRAAWMLLRDQIHAAGVA